MSVKLASWVGRTRRSFPLCSACVANRQDGLSRRCVFAEVARTAVAGSPGPTFVGSLSSRHVRLPETEPNHHTFPQPDRHGHRKQPSMFKHLTFGVLGFLVV